MINPDENYRKRFELRLRLYARGLVSAVELGNLVVTELAYARGFEFVEEFRSRLPSEARTAAVEFAREIAAEGWVRVPMGVGWYPSDEAYAKWLEQEVPVYKQVARLIPAVSPEPTA
jgi:hypothetical protein